MQMGTKSSLSTPEIVGIWNSYVQDSLGVCVFDYFLSKVKDAEIRSILEYAKKLSEEHIVKLKGIFNEEELPVPNGFTKDDVNVNAPGIFTDSFYLWFLNNSLYLGMSAYTVILTNSSRPDIREYFSKSLTESMDLFNKNINLLISKGVFIYAPKVEVLKEMSYVQNNDFLGNWFGEKRPLLPREGTVIYINIVYNLINRALYSGFGQVASSKEVSDFMFKGAKIATEHVEALSNIFHEENIPVPSTSESFITDSTITPFSNKLMIYLGLGMTSMILGNTGVGIVYTFRKDIHTRLLYNGAEYAKYASDGFKIMIENRWLEQPPQIVRSEDLAKL